MLTLMTTKPLIQTAHCPVSIGKVYPAKNHIAATREKFRDWELAVKSVTNGLVGLTCDILFQELSKK